ncbi:hypothetical protein OH76DRAFT_1437991, partial [Lentinus brumalis]
LVAVVVVSGESPVCPPSAPLTVTAPRPAYACTAHRYPRAPYFNPRSLALPPAAISHQPACLSLPPSQACPPLVDVLGRPSLPRV